MANETTPYMPRNPGDLITAEDWNEVQVKVKEDMQDRIQAAKEQIKKTGVDRADNADKFDNKTPKDWTDDLDERYAPKVHDHEGPDVYRRYLKRLKADQKVVLEHKLGSFPLVDVYELLPIAPDLSENPINEKFYLYYHHEERDRDLLFTEDRGMVRWPWGTPFEQLLSEYNVEWEDDDSLGDVINDFLDGFFKSPVVDHMEHSTSPWINDHRKMLIGELKKRDEWPDIRWVFRPHKLIVGLPPVGPHEWPESFSTPSWVDVIHLSYDALAVITPADLEGTVHEETASGETSKVPRMAIDLMILLRS